MSTAKAAIRLMTVNKSSDMTGGLRNRSMEDDGCSASNSINITRSRTLPEPWHGRNESTLTTARQGISTFQPTVSNSSQVAEWQPSSLQTDPDFGTSICSSRHKRNSRYLVFVCPAVIPETRPRCGTITDDDGNTHYTRSVRKRAAVLREASGFRRMLLDWRGASPKRHCCPHGFCLDD